MTMSQNTKEKILKMAVEITKGRATNIETATIDISQREAEELVKYTETIYKGLKSLCEREGIS